MKPITLEDRGVVVCIRATRIKKGRRKDLVICGTLEKVQGDTLGLTHVTVYERLTVSAETVDYSCKSRYRTSINSKRTPCEISIARRGDLKGVRRMIIAAREEGVLLTSEEHDALALVRKLQK